MRTLELIERVNKLDTPIIARFTSDREYIRFSISNNDPFYKIRINAGNLLEGQTNTREMANELVMDHLFKLLELIMEYVETPTELRREPEFRLRLAAPLLSHEKVGRRNDNLYLVYSAKSMEYSLDYLVNSAVNQIEFSDKDIDGLDITGFEKEPI